MIDRVTSILNGDPNSLDGPVVSDKRNCPQQYHTHRCYNFPSETRPLREDDERRGVRQCRSCAAMEDGDVN